MERLSGCVQPYAWGSRTAIPALLGRPPGPEPFAELWFGTHPAAPSPLASGIALGERVAADPEGLLGRSVLAAFGPTLPYLVKLIAPAAPLSLQVHPSLERARAGFAREESDGVPVGAPHRTYRDANHKPEMVYALEPFEAVAGFRTPRRVTELLAGLDTALAWDLFADLRRDTSADGIRAAFTRLLDPATRPSPEQVDETVAAIAARGERGRSPSSRSDGIVAQLGRAYPGDPGAVASLLMNPVSLRPGETLFIPAGGVHCYLSGLAVEVMASSDNVLRAGLTSKHVDTAGVLETVDWVAAPPVRIGPEHVDEHVETFYAPVEDFELSVATLRDARPAVLPGHGPRILLAVDGAIEAEHQGATLHLARGEAAFVPASSASVGLRGRGRLVQVSVP